MSKTAKVMVLFSVLAFAVWYTGVIPLQRVHAQPTGGTWTTTITNVNVAQKRVDVTATRDDVSGGIETYSYSGVILETGSQRTALLNQIWADHEATVAKQATIDAFVSSLESDAKTNLEARE